MHSNYKHKFLFFLACILLGFISCTKGGDENMAVKETKPYLNKKDSLLMVEIYKKAGPWGKKWDLQNIQTWAGVEIAHDTLFNEFRIVGFNYFGSFRGNFPEEFCQLTELRILGLGGGTLSGNIPRDIKNLKKLEWLYVGYNHIYGKIPQEIGELKNLKELTLGENFLSGELPEELGNLTNLEKLTIMSTKISGEIPKSLSKLKKAKFIYLDKNKLSGEFPIEIVNPGCVISCADNNITSMLFDIWDDKNSSYIPDLQGNRLSGKIPDWVKKTDRWKVFSGYVGNQQEGYGYEE